MYRQCTVNPNATECNIGAEINSTLSLWTLPLGTYRYTLSASTAWSTENWVDTTFTVVEKIPVFTWRELDGNPSFVPAQGQYKITGEIVCNFEITNLSIEIVHATSGTVKTYAYIVTNPVEEVRFRTELLDAGELEHGLHDVTIYATALGQKEAVHTFSMAVANGSVIDDTVREEIIAFVNDRNQYSFSTESGLLQDKIRSMSLGDQICMAWSDFSGQTRQFLLDWVSGNNRNTFYVELYKADIAALIAEINEKGTYPSSEMPEWLEEFKKYAVKVGSSGATITLGEFSAFEDLWTLDAQTWKLTKYSTIYKDELKTLTQFKNLFKYTGSFIDSVDTATKYSSAFLKSFCSVFEVHYRDLALLASIYESGYGDTEYRRAVEELTNEYQTRFGTAIATIMDQIKKTVIDAGFKLCEKAVLEYAGATATGYLALAKLGAEIILKVSGIKDHGTNWQDFFVKYSSQQVLAGTYQSAVEKVRSDGSKATDDDINKLQMLFSAYREATARTFEALAKVDTAFARDWNAIANGVRARKMPGVD